jgi:hypothetical protein
MITAALRAEAVRKLSQEPWMRAINLSQPFRPVQRPINSYTVGRKGFRFGWHEIFNV